jgi:ABC-2 type transport system ATP-binding protein
MNSESAIVITSLNKSYDTNHVVKDLSLEVKRGEIFALLGHNGAGKTTTIKMLTTLTNPTSGSATILGHDIITEPNKIKEVIAVSPQESAIAEHLNCYENIELMAKLAGLTAQKSQEETQKFLKNMGLDSYRDHKAKTLSGGLQRRLSIAMALVSDPDVLFLDEPTLGLDPASRKELWNYIEALKGKKTIILTTHYLEEADSLADRIAIIKAGEVVALGTSQELKASYNSTQLATIHTPNISQTCIDALEANEYKVKRTDKGIEVSATNIHFESLISQLHDHGVEVEWFSMSEASLDDVFLSFLEDIQPQKEHV